ncbi:MAG: hypothetical protein WA001_01945 [Patescibacteria group bacterium]
MRNPLDSLSELVTGAVRRESTPPPPSWFRGSQEAWQLICKAKVPVDSRAVWLAGYAREELLAFHERCVEHAVLKRHFRLDLLYRAFDDLAWIKRCEPRESAAYRSGEGTPEIPLAEFWKAWGLALPHPIPAAWIQTRSKLPLPDPPAPGASDAFAAFLRYLKLVRSPATLVESVFDLCIPNPS